MQAYSPLAVKVFGSPEMPAGMKLWFMQSLVLSRLLFNAHVVVPSAAYLTCLNAVYMRVLRRITGDMRFSEDTVSDIEVRNKLGMPSIDCVLQQNRLKYLRRILINQPRVLIAVLHHRPNGKILPWVQLILNDLSDLRKMVNCCQELPPPREHPNEWLTYICACGDTWREIVGRLHYVESVCDRKVAGASPHLLAFRCNLCPASESEGRRAYPTRKALLSHMRVVHNERIPMRRYVSEDGLCIACGTNFRTRIRCIAHLSDSRRTKCWDTILTKEMQALDQSEVDRLDAEDTKTRRVARRSGHIHPIASGSATTKTGKRVGHVVR